MARRSAAPADRDLAAEHRAGTITLAELNQAAAEAGAAATAAPSRGDEPADAMPADAPTA